MPLMLLMALHCALMASDDYFISRPSDKHKAFPFESNNWFECRQFDCFQQHITIMYEHLTTCLWTSNIFDWILSKSCFDCYYYDRVDAWKVNTLGISINRQNNFRCTLHMQLTVWCCGNCKMIPSSNLCFFSFRFEILYGNRCKWKYFKWQYSNAANHTIVSLSMKL